MGGAHPPRNHRPHHDETNKGVALKGYDPVAYFTDHKPVKAAETHKFEYQGAVYEFASEAHRKLFAAAPEKYLSQFDGF